jgi:hypothetical protein
MEGAIMGIAQNMLGTFRNKMAAMKSERLADRQERAMIEEQAKVEYRKAYLEESKKKAAVDARLDVQAGGKFKRKLSAALGKIQSNQMRATINKESPYKNAVAQGETAREKLSQGMDKSIWR